MCSLEDVEICEKGTAEISYVDSEGFQNGLKETDYNDSHTAYYYCNGCGECFDVDNNQPEVWEKVKQHLEGEINE